MTIGILRGVQRTEIDAIWPQAWPLLAPSVALWRGRYDERTLRLRVETAQAQLWLAEENGAVVAAGITWIVPYPTGIKECHVAVAGGDGKGRWPLWAATIAEWAKSEGCALATVHGRGGWQRALNAAGFEHDGVLLTKEL